MKTTTVLDEKEIREAIRAYLCTRNFRAQAEGIVFIAGVDNEIECYGPLTARVEVEPIALSSGQDSGGYWNR